MPMPAASQGTKLTDYPRPSIAVDIAVLTVRDGQLAAVVVQHRLGGLALPGTFLHEGETLADAASRALQDKAALSEVQFSQLHVFDDPARDDRGWVLSVAHIAVVQPGRLASRPERTRLTPVSLPGRLPYGHGGIITRAVEDLRARYRDAPDPDGLLAAEFTLRELRLAHEAVAGRQLQRDWFRRTMEPRLEATGRVAAGARGRPAELFRRAPLNP
jgi:8-oxo-dGTP diphosphatase